MQFASYSSRAPIHLLYTKANLLPESWMTNLCNSNTNAISALINHSMRLDLRNPSDGSTVLHHWSCNPLGTLIENRSEEESPLVVVKLLIEKGADVIALDKKGFSPILHAAHHLPVATSQENLDIFDYLLQKEAIDRSEKIDALELISFFQTHQLEY